MKDCFKFRAIPAEQWQYKSAANMTSVHQSRTFLVQVFNEADDVVRLSVNRTEMNFKKNRWEDGISWEALQEIKDALGFADRDAVEIHPRQCDVINVANMRHLFVVPTLLPFAWRKGKK